MAETPHTELPPSPLVGKRRSRGRRALKWLVLLLLVPVALVLLVLGGLWGSLHLGPVQRWSARIAEGQINQLLSGRLRFSAIEVSGALRVCLRDLSLDDPETGPVITADFACVDVSALALARHQITVRGVQLEHPVVDIATVPAAEAGKTTTTLARALAAKHPTKSQGESGPLAWVIEVQDLDLSKGALRLRPAPKAAPSLALDDLELRNAKARYAEDGALAKLALKARLVTPGPLPAAVELDAVLKGTTQSGHLEVHRLRVSAGSSFVTAWGQLDLGTRAGKLEIAELHVLPADVEALRPPPPVSEEGAPEAKAQPLLSSEVRGKGVVSTDGHRATARLSLQAGGGKIELEAEATIDAKPEWSVNLQALGVDPAGLTPQAPKGLVTVKLAARGKGLPSYDERGVLGDLEGKLHVGPARLQGLGQLSLDLDAKIAGRRGLVRAFTAAGLGLKIAAHGDAARDAVDLFVQVDAPQLTTVARAIGALTKQPPIAIRGAARLYARVRGKPLRPDAEVHLRSPLLQSGDSLEAQTLAVDGELHGDLRHPSEVKPVGLLKLTAERLVAGQIVLDRPSMRANLRWPSAGLQLTAGVLGGRFDLSGEAAIDEDRDGVRIPRLTVSYPGNELRLRQPIAVHFRPKATVVEPFWLEGDHGGLGVAATLGKPSRKGEAGTIDGSLQLSKLDLAALPQFAVPRGLDLRGVVTGQVTVDGRLPRPTVDAHFEVKGGGVKRVQGVDLKLWVHLFRNRLKAQLEGSGPANVRLAFKADAPLGKPGDLPLTAPLHGELSVRGLDVASAVALSGNEKLKAAGLRGTLTALGAFEGTLGSPRVTFSADLTRFSGTVAKKEPDSSSPAAPKASPSPKGANKGIAAAAKALGAAQGAVAPQTGKAVFVTEADVHVGVWLERGLVALDARAALAGGRPVTLIASAPLDVGKLLREPGYLAKALVRPVRATLATSQLELQPLAALGLIPEGITGKVTASVDLDGTPSAPQLGVTASADALGRGKVQGLVATARLDLDEQARLQLGLGAGADVLARLDLTLGVSAKELVDIQQLGDPKLMAQRIAGRTISGDLDVPGLYVGKAIALAGKQRAPADGRLVGKVHLGGTPGEPRIEGRLALEEVRTQSRSLGHAEVYVEGGPRGAIVHVGISPPGGGSLVAHAELKADLTARALLTSGAVGLLQGELSGRLTAKQLDLKFLSGVNPYLRRSAGLLEGDVEAHGLLGSPKTTGKAQLRDGLFDIVGQGIFHNVAFDASFTPKEIVLDKLVGQLGPGTFSAVLVAMNRPPPGKTEGDGLDRLEFTGELHLGDDESVAGRKDQEGKPLRKAPLPIRQAGEERLRVNGEVDLFGHYEGGQVVANLKIPEAGVQVLSLPSKKLESLTPDKDILLVHPNERPHPPGVEPEELDAEEEARRTATLRVQLALELTHLYVKAEDFEFPVRSNLNFEYDARRPDKPTADGTITVPKGSFTALGRRFQIENAVITETGGDITNPELEVKARYEKASTVVFINVSGSARDPVIDLQSNPAMDQDAIAFFLATGRVQGRATQGGGGVDLQGAASSVVGSYLFGAVRKELAAVLPVDVLTVETSGVGVSQASIGKYFGDAFFIGYRQRVTPAPNENTSEGRIEYEISRQVTAEATIGDHKSDVSILWSKDF